MYVAVKGGEKAIAAAHALLARERRGDVQIPEVTLEQLAGQLKLAVDRIMAEGSLYSPELAALAFKQAQGDAVEAIFLLRAYRTTLPRFGVSEPMDTSRMRVERRISATWKDLPGGQILGSTFDYTHRLLDRGLAVPGTAPRDVEPERTAEDLAMMAADAQALLQEPLPRAMDALGREGLMESVAPSHEGNDCPDITRQPLELPADGSGDRAVRLQSMARADEGFLLGMAYSTQRGYGAVHPFTGELRRGFVELTVIPEELGFAITLGEVELTECDMVSRYTGRALEPCFTRGYGLVFGNNERKALSMSIVDRALRARELQEDQIGPAQNPEFVLMHGDNVDASGFVQHIKLPHYVDFQAELSLIRQLRERKYAEEQAAAASEKHAENLTTTPAASGLEGYNFAYLDEGTKRMVRRALLKAVAIPGYQVPFASREMPMPYGWGTGGIQVTASIIGRDDVLKEASIIQTRHRIPEQPLREDQIMVYQVPMPEPLRWLEPSEKETRTLHALEEYGIMSIKLYEDIMRHGDIATGFDYPVKVNGRYIMSPSPIPRFDNPKMHQCPALQLFGAGREKRIYAIPPYTDVVSLDFEDYPFTPQSWDQCCAICGATDTYLDEIVMDDAGTRMFVCSDTDNCARRVAGQGGTAAPREEK